MSTDDLSAADRGSGLSDQLGQASEARWYCLDRDGVAMLCKDEEDARAQVVENDDCWPQRAPHRAALLGDVAAERERCGRAYGSREVAMTAEIARLRERVFELEADPTSGDVISLAAERERWASRVDGLTAQLRAVDARYMALLKAVADGVALQKPPTMMVTSWTCAKCQTDRLKAPCPLGPSAQADGRCPCVGVALGA